MKCCGTCLFYREKEKKCVYLVLYPSSIIHIEELSVSMEKENGTGCDCWRKK